MAVWSVMDLSQMHRSERWDTEFYQPAYLQLERLLKTTCTSKVCNVASLSVSSFNSANVDEIDYAEIAGVDLNIGTVLPERLHASIAPDRAKYLMQGGEILVSTVRPNRSCIGIIPDVIGPVPLVASSGFLPLKANDKFFRALLFVWMKTQFVTDWLERHTSASMYPAVSVTDILNTPVPLVSDVLLEKIRALFEKMLSIIENGQNAYPEAEAELLERLDWNGLRTTPQELFYTRSITDITKSQRCDPEFFLPLYDRIRRRINECGGMPLGSLVYSFSKGTQPPGYAEHGNVVVLKSKNVYGRGINWDDCDRAPDTVKYDPQSHITEGDVVINATGRGTLGRGEAIDSSVPQKAIAAVDLIICRPDIDKVDPTFLALFLNSPAGLVQSDQFQTGSSGQLHLYTQHLEQFQIFIPRNNDGNVDLAWQFVLASKVQQAQKAKIEAREKLEEAKHLLEDALRL